VKNVISDLFRVFEEIFEGESLHRLQDGEVFEGRTSVNAAKRFNRARCMENIVCDEYLKVESSAYVDFSKTVSRRRTDLNELDDFAVDTHDSSVHEL
jgi:hypothetical protein